MAFCPKCGVQIDSSTQFCPSCGAQIQAAAPQQPQYQQPQQAQQQPVNAAAQAFANFNNTPDTTAQYDPTDIQQNKVMAVLAYLGILWLIPFFAAKNSPFATFHVKQGLPLLLVEVAYSILSILLNLIKTPHYVYGVHLYDSTPWWVGLLLFVIFIPIAVLAIMGIINAATGKAKELPIIGKFKIMK